MSTSQPGVSITRNNGCIGSSADHLPAILITHTLHHGWRWPHHISVCQAKTFNPLIQALAQQQSLVLRTVAVFVTVGEFDETPEWRIAVATTNLYFGGVKLVVVVARGGINTEVLWIEGLDNYAAGLLTTTCSAG